MMVFLTDNCFSTRRFNRPTDESANDYPIFSICWCLSPLQMQQNRATALAMTVSNSVRRLFRVPDDEPNVLVAQARALSRQVPILHTILSLDAMGVAYTHYGVAPDGLTILPLAVLLSACAGRVLIWSRTHHHAIGPEEALRRLRGTNRLAAILGSGFAIWAILLTRYGDAATNLHVLYFLSITMIACISCLTHLRTAALIVSALAVPVSAYFLVIGAPVVRAAALNYVGVVVVMLFMQSVYYRDFRRLTRLTEENHALAHTDPLTGLPNRRSFFAELEQAIAAAGTAETRFAIGLIDLDGFKPVNDTLGHLAGDAVLCEVGRRLRTRRRGGRGRAPRRRRVRPDPARLAGPRRPRPDPVHDPEAALCPARHRRADRRHDRLRALPRDRADRGNAHRAGRPRALPCQGPRAGHRGLLRVRAREPDAPAGPGRAGAAPGRPRGRVPPAVPADRRRRRRAGPGLRGAGALEQPDPRPRLAGRLHRGGRAHRADPRPQPRAAPQGARGDGVLARARGPVLQPLGPRPRRRRGHRDDHRPDRGKRHRARAHRVRGHRDRPDARPRRRRPRRSAPCGRSASASRSTISAPAIPASATSTACRSAN